MPAQGVRKTSKGQGGFRTVTYRDARGRTMNATVTGPGTGQTVNLRIRDRSRGNVSNQIVSNVSLTTSKTATGVYHNRIS